VALWRTMNSSGMLSLSMPTVIFILITPPVGDVFGFNQSQ
jgi:hypothetical protein